MPKKTSIEHESLRSLLNQDITLYLANGKAVTGKLLKFDEHTIEISGRTADSHNTYIKLKHVTTYHAGRPKKGPDAPD
jgi:sRNA-binding regulator protein Hfq